MFQILQRILDDVSDRRSDLGKLWFLMFLFVQPVEGRNIFPQGATAVKVASAENNVEMLKLLRYYNAEPIQMPDVSPETGTN